MVLSCPGHKNITNDVSVDSSHHALDVSERYKEGVNCDVVRTRTAYYALVLEQYLKISFTSNHANV